jgi:polyferredoxin
VTAAAARRLKTLRIASQAVFGALFLLTYLASLDPFARVVNLFLRSDPLVFLTHLVVQPLPFALMLALLALALLAGRAFCGWICPLGGLIDLLDLAVGPVRRLLQRGAWRHDRRAGVAPRGFARALTALPPSIFLLGLLVPSLFLAPPVLQALHPNVWSVRIVSLSPVGLAFAAALLLAGLAGRRLWCRYLCPLGALYGLLARLAPLRLRIRSCSACGRCDGCPMGAADPAAGRVLAHQCILCFDYEHRCPTQGFVFGRQAAAHAATGDATVDMHGARGARAAALAAAAAAPAQPGRREFLRQTAAAAAGAVVAAAVGFGQRAPTTRLLRPPGVVNEPQFLERCLRCLQCVRSCPNGIIKITGPRSGASGPAALAPLAPLAGLESLLTPHLEFGEYGCDYLCQVCQQVCPNFAIPLQTLADKQSAVIGRAVLAERDCVVFRDRTNCLVCEEVCPVPGKAIGIREGDATAAGEKLRYPVVDTARCIGCGICEAACPSTPLAIRVTRA